MTSEPNRYAAPMDHEVEVEKKIHSGPPRFTPLSVGIMVAGLLLGCVAFALVSNQFGNTDTYGIMLMLVAGAVFGFGFAMNRSSRSHAILVAIAFGIAAPVSLSALYILYFIVFAIYRLVTS